MTQPSSTKCSATWTPTNRVIEHHRAAFHDPRHLRRPPTPLHPRRHRSARRRPHLRHRSQRRSPARRIRPTGCAGPHSPATANSTDTACTSATPRPGASSTTTAASRSSPLPRARPSARGSGHPRQLRQSRRAAGGETKALVAQAVTAECSAWTPGTKGSVTRPTGIDLDKARGFWHLIAAHAQAGERVLVPVV